AGFGQHGDTARVVAAILQTPQSFDQNRDDVTLRYRADNATHKFAFPRDVVSDEASRPESSRASGVTGGIGRLPAPMVGAHAFAAVLPAPAEPPFRRRPSWQ